MARGTRIEWCTATWNPWYGCHKVSPACDNCYAETWAKRTGRDFGTVVRSRTTFEAPLKWRKPERIFVCSLSDFLHPDADCWRDEAMEIMRQANHHTYLILTKRIGRMGKTIGRRKLKGVRAWFGVTAETQYYADRRIPSLSYNAAWAEVRFVSCEPLLGPIDLEIHFSVAHPIDWVIVGGESGPNFRPMDQQWVWDIMSQCKRAQVPFFFKQWDGSRPAHKGRFFMGREWNDIPETSHARL